MIKQKSLLTEKQIEILKMLAQGQTNNQIAQVLNISVRTVKYHTTNIYSKIGVYSRSEAIAWAWKNRFMEN